MSALTHDQTEYLRTVASAYDKLDSFLEDAAVVQAYDTLKRELLAQFAVVSALVDVSFVEDDPYTSSRAMFEDISVSHHINVYTGGSLPSTHPFAAIVDSLPDGRVVTLNSVFRAVHDILAHYPGRYSFSALGELRAFQAHCKLLSMPAQWAIATETLGQNAWYSFGPKSSFPSKPFAEQKADLLPWSLVHKGLTI